jgi:hypothetical protein
MATPGGFRLGQHYPRLRLIAHGDLCDVALWIVANRPVGPSSPGSVS